MKLLKKSVITGLILLGSIIGNSQETTDINEIDIDLIYGEWLYDLKTVDFFAKDIQNDLIKNSSRREQKMYRSGEFLASIKDFAMTVRTVFKTQEVNIIMSNDTVRKSWVYDHSQKTIETQNLQDTAIPKERMVIKQLSKSNLVVINKDGKELRYIPAPKKIKETLYSEISKLASFQGMPESDIVIINTQGGPVHELDDYLMFNIMRSTNTLDLLYVNVHQAQTQNKSLFEEKDISFEKAKEYDDKSIENLITVINYFKKHTNKKIYVLGISFGAFVVQGLIVKHGVDDADGYFAIVGRLDIEEKFWKGFSEGKNGYFKFKRNNKYRISLSKEKDALSRNMNRLAAGLGYKRYTKELQKVDNLSKLTYIYGGKDDKVGKLTEKEISFLTSKKANVILIPDADHSNAINSGLTRFKQIIKQ